MRRLLVCCGDDGGLPVRSAHADEASAVKAVEKLRRQGRGATQACGQAGDRGDPHRPRCDGFGLKELKISTTRHVNLSNTR